MRQLLSRTSAVVFVSFILPLTTFAAVQCPEGSVPTADGGCALTGNGYRTPASAFDQFLAGVLREIVDPLITVIALAAFVVFVWGVVNFIGSAGDAEKRKTGQQHIMWGIIGLAVLFGAKAIIAILANTIGV